MTGNTHLGTNNQTIKALSHAFMTVLLCLSILACLIVTSHQAIADATTALPIESESVDQYLIGPNDVLDISVWREEELVRTLVVRPDGYISFPLVGEISAASRTPGELQHEITQRLMKFIPEPVVTVIISKVDSYSIYVIGEVRNSGKYQSGHYIDVVQALALAGGLTAFAAENRIRILRRIDGHVTAIPFEYSRIKSGRGMDQNIILMRGDVVVVP